MPTITRRAWAGAGPLYRDDHDCEIGDMKIYPPSHLIRCGNGKLLY